MHCSNPPNKCTCQIDASRSFMASTDGTGKQAPHRGQLTPCSDRGPGPNGWLQQGQGMTAGASGLPPTQVGKLSSMSSSSILSRMSAASSAGTFRHSSSSRAWSIRRVQAWCYNNMAERSVTAAWPTCMSSSYSGPGNWQSSPFLISAACWVATMTPSDARASDLDRWPARTD